MGTQTNNIWPCPDSRQAFSFTIDLDWTKQDNTGSMLAQRYTDFLLNGVTDIHLILELCLTRLIQYLVVLLRMFLGRPVAEVALEDFEPGLRL
jgi:hypothetical protein